MLLTDAKVFAPSTLKYRIFTKAPTVNLRERLLVLAQAGEGDAVNHLGRQVRLRELAFDGGPVAQVVVDLNGSLVQVNERARTLFRLGLKDLGRPLQDLELSYRPAELRSSIEQAYANRGVVRLTNVEHQLPGGHLHLDVQVAPLVENGATLLGASITFEDVSERQRLQAEVQRTTQALETANEELQSTNEELETMNEELRLRTTDLNQSNAFLRSILAALRAGVAVVDRQLTVLVWNHRAEDLWGLRADEVQGKSLLGMDIGLPVEQLPLPAFLAGKADFEVVSLAATNRRGRAIQCQVTCTPFLGSEGERAGVVLLMEDMPR
jgi:two-component system CheB/CheR fusion protein